MKFKSTEDQYIVVYRDDGFDYSDRHVAKGEIIHVNFNDVVESYFNFDVNSGGFIPLDPEAHDWVCIHTEVAC